MLFIVEYSDISSATFFQREHLEKHLRQNLESAHYTGENQEFDVYQYRGGGEVAKLHWNTGDIHRDSESYIYIEKQLVDVAGNVVASFTMCIDGEA